MEKIELIRRGAMTKSTTGEPQMQNRTYTLKRSPRFAAVNVRKLKKELKRILADIHREMRYLDLLFLEKNKVRTQVERDVVKELIERAKKVLETHQNKMDRYRECYQQFKARKSFDSGLLKPEELESLIKIPLEKESPDLIPVHRQQNLRTGTDG